MEGRKEGKERKGVIKSVDDVFSKFKNKGADYSLEFSVWIYVSERKEQIFEFGNK